MRLRQRNTPAVAEPPRPDLAEPSLPASAASHAPWTAAAPQALTTAATPRRGRWVVMLLENCPYPQDPRVRNEAESLRAAGWRVTVIAPHARERQAPREVIDGVEVVRFWLPVTSRNAVGYLIEYTVAHVQLARFALARLFAGADIVHVNNPPDTLALVFPLVRLLGKRSVFDNHDLFPELFAVRYGDDGGNTRAVGLLRAFQRLAFRRADLVLTTNESQREIVLDAVDRDPRSVVVVRNGPKAETVRGARVQPDEPQTATVDAAAESPAPGPLDGRPERAGLELLFLGALEPQDGVMTLADVLRILVDDRGLDAHLTVVGIGSCKAELETRCSELHLDERVTFTGWVAHEQVPRLLEAADVCLDPAACNELNHRSTMIKIAEYMAAARPIVAFDLRETRRTAGDAVLYAACDDVEGFAAHVAELAARPSLRRELAQRAAERMPELLWERSAEALLAAYARLLPA
jgi:glycosyltransferase involved in cell wall biosynthesis